MNYRELRLRAQSFDEQWPQPRPKCNECGDNEAECPHTDYAGEKGLCSRCWELEVYDTD